MSLKKFLFCLSLLIAFAGRVHADDVDHTDQISVLPVKITATVKPAKMKFAEPIPIDVRVLNTGHRAQNIGKELCGVEGVNGWIASDPALEVSGRSPGCNSKTDRPRSIILKPRETYEQTCLVSYSKKGAHPAPFAFRLSLKNREGNQSPWSNPISFKISGNAVLLK